jgi:chromosome segregation protein
MPTRLKSLELHGYKTFASRTLFEFAGTVTAIVGPNGSGKSNIADALRWVLGEQSYSLLRGKKTEDMIFAGSEQRARAGMASATVVFDNGEGWLPIDFGEVAIARRAYRDGQNEYLLNGQRVRLRDVSELLSQSGLAERTYTIIGQGLVDAALALKAEERRRLFEEAAGIGLHRSRREEALRRLEATHRNLVRIQDILAELQPRLRSLERQAKRAQEYEQVKADLRVVLREWYGFHWHREQRYLLESRNAARKQETVLEKAKKVQEGLDNELKVLREQIQELRARLNGWHRKSAELHSQRERYSRNLAVAGVQLRSLEDQRSLLLSDQVSFQEQTGLLQDRLEAAEGESVRLHSELLEAQGQAEIVRTAFRQRQAERSAVETELETARGSLARMAAGRSELSARLAERTSQVQRSQTILESLRTGIVDAQVQLSEAEERTGARQANYEEGVADRIQAEQKLRDYTGESSSLEADRREIIGKHSELQTEMARLKAQLEVLDQAEQALSGHASGARLLIQAAREEQITGVRGALSSHLDVPAELEVAVAAALGEYLDAIILDEGADLETALTILQNGPARGVLLPLGRLLAKEIPAPGNLAGRIIGMAGDLVSTADSIRPAVQLLLGDVLVVEDRETAENVVEKLAQRDLEGQADGLRVVTLNGEVYQFMGPVIAGHEGRVGNLSRPRQRRELVSNLAKFEKTAGGLEDRIRELDKVLDERRVEEGRLVESLASLRQSEEAASAAYSQEKIALEQASRQLRWQEEQLNRLEKEIQSGQENISELEAEKTQAEQAIQQRESEIRVLIAALADLVLDDSQAQVSHWEMRMAVIQEAAENAQLRSGERREALEAAHRQLADVQARLSEAEKTSLAVEGEISKFREAEGKVSVEIESLLALIRPAEKELDRAEAEQLQLQKKEADSRQALNLAEHHHAQAKISLAKRQEALDTLRRRIEDDFGLVAFEYDEEVSGQAPLPLGDMVEELPRVLRLSPETEEALKRQRALLRRIGPVNPEAQAEYREVKERYEFLRGQMDDLNLAEEDVRQVINELDELMQREFQRTYEAVAIEFRQIFARLFGGGSARLVMTDPEDLTLTGIDIEARLPGRREQGLSLLSGGERSLTAVALVFALLRVAPTPFCILDEVDAMLDEANVGRFRELLRELSASTQFIIITHNRNTVQVADVLYGVTMGRDSSSQLVSLKLDEVEIVV